MRFYVTLIHSGKHEKKEKGEKKGRKLLISMKENGMRKVNKNKT